MATWQIYRKAPMHWESIIPHGYFIVIEKNDDGDEEYALYQGDFNDWMHPTGNPMVPLGKYATLKDAKDAAP